MVCHWSLSCCKTTLLPVSSASPSAYPYRFNSHASIYAATPSKWAATGQYIWIRPVHSEFQEPWSDDKKNECRWLCAGHRSSSSTEPTSETQIFATKELIENSSVEGQDSHLKRRCMLKIIGNLIKSCLTFLQFPQILINLSVRRLLLLHMWMLLLMKQIPRERCLLDLKRICLHLMMCGSLYQIFLSLHNPPVLHHLQDPLLQDQLKFQGQHWSLVQAINQYSSPWH